MPPNSDHMMTHLGITIATIVLFVHSTMQSVACGKLYNCYIIWSKNTGNKDVNALESVYNGVQGQELKDRKQWPKTQSTTKLRRPDYKIWVKRRKRICGLEVMSARHRSIDKDGGLH